MRDASGTLATGDVWGTSGFPEGLRVQMKVTSCEVHNPWREASFQGKTCWKARIKNQGRDRMVFASAHKEHERREMDLFSAGHAQLDRSMVHRNGDT